jgi:hypothetical protein
LKLVSVAAADKETVGVVTSGQFYTPCGDSFSSQTLRQALRRFLATAVGIGIQGQVDCATLAAAPVVSTQLAELQRIQVGSQSAGDVVESGLP